MGVNFARITTDDRDLSQMQTNLVNAFKSVNNQLNQASVIGEIRQAALTLEQFQASAGNVWVACNGQNIAGSPYAKQTGLFVTPTIATSGGVSSFIRIA